MVVFGNSRNTALNQADLDFLILMNKPIAVLYDACNGVDTANYYFNTEEANAAEEKVRGSNHYSVVYFEEEIDVSL